MILKLLIPCENILSLKKLHYWGEMKMNTVITLTWQVWLYFFLLETKTAKAKSLGG